MKTSLQKSILSVPEIRKSVDVDTQVLLRRISSAPTSTGRRFSLRYLNGQVLTRSQAILAHCCECQGFYKGGKIDCEQYLCPLYPYMPYGQMWQRYIRPDRRKV